MRSVWRSAHRWYLDRRARVLDLSAVLLVWAMGGVALLVFEIPTFPALTGDLAFKWMIWAVLLVFTLLLYGWRRWREIDYLLAEAETDVLTGLNNRRKTERLLAHEFDRALRYGRPLSIVMIDIDFFKRVNDEHGHGTGDVVLAAIARRIRRRMRISDHFGRWGGEEFLLICPETDTEGAMKIAERMRRTVKQRPMLKAGVVTASFGVSCYAGQGDYDVMVEEADAYLYMAKQQGRDRIMSRLIVMEQLRRGDGTVFLEITQPTEPSLSAQLSTLMSTIAAPLRRDKRRR